MSATIAVLEGDQTGQELLEEALRVIAPEVIGIELELRRFDLSLANRRATANAVVLEAADAMVECGFGLKAATVTPETAGDVRSPNALLRQRVGGKVILRTGRRIPGVPSMGGVSAPISVVRMAVDDAYTAKEWREQVDGDEVAYRTEHISRATCHAVSEFAFAHARRTHSRVFGGPKFTVSPVYEGLLKEEMDAAASRYPDVAYEPQLIDATYALLLSHGGDALVIPALNRDGDCLSDFVLQLFGSIAGAESLLLGFTEDSSRPDVVMAEAPARDGAGARGQEHRQSHGHDPGRRVTPRLRGRRPVQGRVAGDVRGHLRDRARRHAHRGPRRPRVHRRVHQRGHRGGAQQARALGLTGDELILPQRIYLDHAASTPVAPAVVDAMVPFLREHWGNPSSPHARGRGARSAVDEARDRLAAVLRCAPRELTFTSGGTEADNLAIRGAVQRWGAERGRHVVVSAIEHEAVLTTAAMLAERGEAEVSVVGCDSEGRVDPERVAAAVRDDTVLVSLMLANNEVGTVQDVATAARLARARNSRVLVHSDAVQALGRLPIDPAVLDVDMLSVSAHKCYGPKGCGALFARWGTFLTAQLDGGGQERGAAQRHRERRRHRRFRGRRGARRERADRRGGAPGAAS